MQSIFAHQELAFRIENDKVRVVASSEAPFLGAAAS
jgi:hypothetical protein